MNQNRNREPQPKLPPKQRPVNPKERKKLKKNLNFSSAKKNVFAFARKNTTGAKGPSRFVHRSLRVSAACLFASIAATRPATASACIVPTGSHSSIRCHVSRARGHAPSRSCNRASCPIEFKCCLYTIEPHSGQASVIGGSHRLHSGQLWIGSGIEIDSIVSVNATSLRAAILTILAVSPANSCPTMPDPT